MNKLQKLDDVIQELENEVINLQEIHRVYQQIENLSADYQKVIEAIQNNYELLENLLNKHENFQENVLEKIQNSVSESTVNLEQVIANEFQNGIQNILQANLTFQNVFNTYLDNFNEFLTIFNNISENIQKSSEDFQSKHLENQKVIVETLQNYAQIQQEISLNLQNFLTNFYDQQQKFHVDYLNQLKKNHEEVLGNFYKAFESLSEYVKSFKSDFESLIVKWLLEFRESQENFQENLKKEQKVYYRDLEDLVRIKLDENKSEIKVFVDQLISSLKESLSFKIEKQMEEAKKNIVNTNRIWMIINLLLTIVIGVVLFLQLKGII